VKSIRITAGAVVLILALFLLNTFVFASYQAPFTVVESGGNNYTMLPVMADANNKWMADNGFMEATALDTRVETLDGLEKPHMVADDRTLTAIPVPAYSQTNLYFTTGNSDLSAMYVIVGTGGEITVADHANLELGDTFDIEMKVYVDTSAGASKNLIYKNAAFQLYISAAGSITATVTGGNLVTATTVATGLHTVHVYADGSELAIQIDAGAPVTNAVGFAAVPDNGNEWKYMQNDVIPYMEYLKVVVG